MKKETLTIRFNDEKHKLDVSCFDLSKVDCHEDVLEKERGLGKLFLKIISLKAKVETYHGSLKARYERQIESRIIELRVWMSENSRYKTLVNKLTKSEFKSFVLRQKDSLELLEIDEELISLESTRNKLSDTYFTLQKMTDVLFDMNRVFLKETRYNN